MQPFIFYCLHFLHSIDKLSVIIYLSIYKTANKYWIRWIEINSSHSPAVVCACDCKMVTDTVDTDKHYNWVATRLILAICSQWFTNVFCLSLGIAQRCFRFSSLSFDESVVLFSLKVSIKNIPTQKIRSLFYDEWRSLLVYCAAELNE